MSDSPSGRDDHPNDERAIPDGGARAVSRPAQWRTVANRTLGTSASDSPRPGTSDGEHLFGPAELPPWALSFPVIAALAVTVGAQGTSVLSTGGGSAWLGTVLTTIGILVVVSIALRSA